MFKQRPMGVHAGSPADLCVWEPEGNPKGARSLPPTSTSAPWGRAPFGGVLMPAEEPAVERGLTPQAGPGCSRPRQCVERGVLAEGEQEKAEGWDPHPAPSTPEIPVRSGTLLRIRVRALRGRHSRGKISPTRPSDSVRTQGRARHWAQTIFSGPFHPECALLSFSQSPSGWLPREGRSSFMWTHKAVKIEKVGGRGETFDPGRPFVLKQIRQTRNRR